MFQTASPDFSKLLKYYQQEMSYLLKAGQSFATAYPRAAQGLDFSQKGFADPHVQRLLESFAFLTGRLQLEIEDEYSFFTTALLSVLYPQFVNPFPSCVTIQLNSLPDMAQQLAGTVIPARTTLIAPAEEGQTCLFQTTMATKIWPFEVVDLSYERSQSYDLPTPVKSPWMLRARIRSHTGTFEGFDVDRLKFYLGGDTLTAFTLFRWIHTYDADRQVPIFVQNKPQGPLTLLPQDALSPTGFREDEAIVPTPLQTASAYRLLLEYFVFPQKFLYLDVGHVRSAIAHAEGPEISLFFALHADAQPDKWPLAPGNLSLGCVPATNLFFKTAEPIRLDQKKAQYRLLPDQRRESTMEIHSILKVSSAVDFQTPAQIYEPYFSYTHETEKKNHALFWLSHRTRASNPDMQGTDVHLSFVDYEMNLDMPAQQVVYAHTLCTNRKLAEQVPVKAFLDLQGAFTGIVAHTLDRPTKSVQPPMDGAAQWRLISHLSVDHLSLSNEMNSIAPLRELFSLYNFSRSSLAIAAEAIQSVTFQQTIERIGIEAWRGFVPMISVKLIVDDIRANTQGFFMLTMILHELFRLSAGFNTLVETQMVGLNGSVIKKWPPSVCTAHLL